MQLMCVKAATMENVSKYSWIRCIVTMQHCIPLCLICICIYHFGSFDGISELPKYTEWMNNSISTVEMANDPVHKCVFHFMLSTDVFFALQTDNSLFVVCTIFFLISAVCIRRWFLFYSLNSGRCVSECLYMPSHRLFRQSCFVGIICLHEVYFIYICLTGQILARWFLNTGQRIFGSILSVLT